MSLVVEADNVTPTPLNVSDVSDVSSESAWVEENLDLQTPTVADAAENVSAPSAPRTIEVVARGDLSNASYTTDVSHLCTKMPNIVTNSQKLYRSTRNESPKSVDFPSYKEYLSRAETYQQDINQRLDQGLATKPYFKVASPKAVDFPSIPGLESYPVEEAEKWIKGNTMISQRIRDREINMLNEHMKHLRVIIEQTNAQIEDAKAKIRELHDEPQPDSDDARPDSVDAQPDSVDAQPDNIDVAVAVTHAPSEEDATSCLGVSLNLVRQLFGKNSPQCARATQRA